MNIVAGKLIMSTQVLHSNSLFDLSEIRVLDTELCCSPPISMAERRSESSYSGIAFVLVVGSVGIGQRLVSEAVLAFNILLQRPPRFNMLVLYISLSEIFSVTADKRCNDGNLVQGSPPRHRAVCKTCGQQGESLFGHLAGAGRSEEHTSELQSRQYLVCRLLLEKK